MIEEHSHCEMCGRPVEVEVFLCTRKECLEKKDEVQRMKKRSVLILVVMIVAAVILAKLL